MLIYDSMFNHPTTCTYKLFGLNDSLEPSTISYEVTQSKGSILIRLYLVCLYTVTQSKGSILIEPSTISYTVTQSKGSILIEPSTISYTVAQSDQTILSMKANSPTKT